jgi:hypothetical protein
MTTVVVADAGPLIGLARIDRLSVLASLCGSVLVPELVLVDVLLQHRTLCGVPQSRRASKTYQSPLAPCAYLTQLLARAAGSRHRCCRPWLE